MTEKYNYTQQYRHTDSEKDINLYIVSVNQSLIYPFTNSCLCQTNIKTMYNTKELIPGSVFMSGSLWLNKTCTYAEDCSDQNTICYNTSSTSVCLCTPGYFYSNSCNTCVPGKQINHQSLKYVPDRLEYFFNIQVPLKSYPTFPSSYLQECPLFLRRM